jgi:3-oxoacyl-ACP reductase-like protein
MIDRKTVALACLLAVLPGVALGQSTDAAAERARLANERIEAEAERRAREEQEQQNRAAAPVAPVPASAPSRAPAGPAGPAAPTGPATAADLTAQGLEQLRELVKMKEAGNLTDAEFQRIKQKILDSHF